LFSEHLKLDVTIIVILMVWNFLFTLTQGIAQLSDAACDITYEDRSSCDDAILPLDETQCTARGCCYDDTDSSSPYTCWQPIQGDISSGDILKVWALFH
jgi:hypothetical protein